MITYTKLKNGDWGLRSDSPLSVGRVVTVSKKDGTTKTENVGKEVYTCSEFSLYAIVQSSRTQPQGTRTHHLRGTHSQGQGNKRCWECGRSFTYADARANDGDWSDSYCGC